jgi:hypothetical protein
MAQADSNNTTTSNVISLFSGRQATKKQKVDTPPQHCQADEIAELLAHVEARITRDAAAGKTEETPRERRCRERQEAKSVTETGRNHRLRQRRRDVWWAAAAETRFWATKKEFDDAVVTAQRNGIKESFAYSSDDHRMPNVKKWREALVQQLLTPAPDISSVNWKKAALAGGQYRHIGVKRERIERAIADDVAWLAAHPVRQSKRREAVGPCPAEELEPA